MTVPSRADIVVIGGGAAGAALTARLAERSDRSILLLEAGPDYGSYEGGAWPAELLDVRILPSTHEWGYFSSGLYGLPGLVQERARVIGGCSSHNHAVAAWGHREDYDAWERLSNPGWGADALRPLFDAAAARMKVSTPAVDDLTPFYQAVYAAGPAAGYPRVETLRQLDQEVLTAVYPTNRVDNMRWNTAFAYLDPVRGRPNLTIQGNALVDRVVVEDGRARAVELVGPRGRARVEAELVVVSGGAFGSPSVLMRSGIGEPEALREAGIEPKLRLPGVGKNLHDHPLLRIWYTGTPELAAAMDEFESRAVPGQNGVLIRARSSRNEGPFDLHLFPWATRVGEDWAADPRVADPRLAALLAARASDGGWIYSISSSLQPPRSRGSIRLKSPDPEAMPVIDPGYWTDLGNDDIARVVEGIGLARALANTEPLKRLIGDEWTPGLAVDSAEELRAYIRANSAHGHHPCGTCKMGPASDPSAVVDARGKVHGVEGLYVADASIMPSVPRSPTHFPSIVIGEKIASLLLL